jgi:uncharacterized protein (TIGR00369 family)
MDDDPGGVTEPDQALTDLLHAQMPFTAGLGLVAIRAGAEEVVARAEWREDRCTVGGMIHGGYLMALADSIGAACAAFNLPTDSGGTTTVESSTRFLRAVRDGAITIVASPLHIGRSTLVIQTDITRADGALVSRTLQTQAIIAQS